MLQGKNAELVEYTAFKPGSKMCSLTVHQSLLRVRVTFRSGANQAITNRLVREVQGLNADFLGQQIRGKSKISLFYLHYAIQIWNPTIHSARYSIPIL